MFLSSLSKFLAITPSRIGQEDFNQLGEVKKNNLQKYQQKLSKFEADIASYNQFESLKCLKSGKYLSNL